MKRIKCTNKGYTLIELLIVIAIIGILTAIGIVSYTSVQSDSRNSQRLSKINVVSEALEKYYDQNGNYPTCDVLINTTTATTTLNGLDQNALVAPSGTTGVSSFVVSSTDPTSDQFVCTVVGSGFILKYKEEGSGTVKTISSRRTNPTGTYSLALTHGNGGTVSGAGSYNSGETPTITATPTNSNYVFSSWTGSAGCSGAASHTITMDAAKSCTANFASTAIAVPAAPVVTATTSGATTTWTWPAVACTGTNTVRYQYRYTINSTTPYDSGLIANTSRTTGALTTSTENLTYTVAVQAQCYNAAATSGWSVEGSASYYRPITTYTLTLAASPVAGGTVTGAGTYNNGTIQAITATANTYYTFSSWSGTDAADCADLSVTMTANKSCTANFIPTTIPAPAAPTVTNVVHATNPAVYRTWNWTPGSTCQSGSSMKYIYQMTTINPTTAGSWSSLVTTTTADFTTSTEGTTYTLNVVAYCYNATTNITSASSTPASSSPYTRPYSLALTAGTGGTVSQSGTSPYAPGATPTITASPSAGYRFGSWTGSTGCSGVASHTITMDATKSCTANFVAQYVLTLTAGTGGTVSGAGTYDTGSNQTITATPNAYYSFSSWTGSTGCSGVSIHTITMDATKACTANFSANAVAAPSTPNVVVDSQPTASTTRWRFSPGTTGCQTAGSVITYSYQMNTANPVTTGSWTYAGESTTADFTTSTEGTTYTLYVVANCYNATSGVTSASSSAGSASYTRPITTYTLTLAASPVAGGSVSKTGTSPYNAGSTPTITATANSGYTFSSWTGTNCSGVASHVVPAMTANMSCTANFTVITYVLTLTAGANGTVSGAGTYNSGSTPTMTATANSGYTFSSWTGSTGCSGVASHTITMNAAKSCTANFVAALVTPATPNWIRVISTPISGYYWNIALCGTGNSSRYEHYWTDGPNHYDNNGNYIGDFTSPTYTYDAGTSTGPYSSNVAWAWPLVPTWYSGNSATVYVRAQCYNGSNNSGWSAWGQGGVYTP